MAVLNKTKFLFDRDEDGELIPREITLDVEDKPTIKIIPLVRGEIARIFSLDNTEIDRDKEVIMKGVVEPKFTEEDLEFMKPFLVKEMSEKIMQNSGIVESEKTTEDDVIKKSEVKQDTKD